ncbi:unnamed protein product [Penicillium olsonii]|uniref:TFIID subunit TAF5 NTD2 domain-containing protein n=1 Tax=Penicillium olsonii TaxID=99116 RepID=A0A9W4HJM2_PENOL|nr:unnamed protein product [Penicillium olsonii]CAG8289113.1 unnamed protein product [Penicillium olsonii]
MPKPEDQRASGFGPIRSRRGKGRGRIDRQFRERYQPYQLRVPSRVVLPRGPGNPRVHLHGFGMPVSPTYSTLAEAPESEYPLEDDPTESEESYKTSASDSEYPLQDDHASVSSVVAEASNSEYRFEDDPTESEESYKTAASDSEYPLQDGRAYSVSSVVAEASDSEYPPQDDPTDSTVSSPKVDSDLGHFSDQEDAFSGSFYSAQGDSFSITDPEARPASFNRQFGQEYPCTPSPTATAATDSDQPSEEEDFNSLPESPQSFAPPTTVGPVIAEQEIILPSIEFDQDVMGTRSSQGLNSPTGSRPKLLPQTRANREKRAREKQTQQRLVQALEKEALEKEAFAKEAQEDLQVIERLDSLEMFETLEGEDTKVDLPLMKSPSPSPRARSLGPRMNEVVIDYLAKKGYSRTEAMLRMESANQEIDGRPLPQLGEDSRPKTRQGFDLFKNWVEENLDLYKVGLQQTFRDCLLITSQPELRRVLWPLFVYSFFNMVTSFYPQDAKSFFEANKNMFLPEHTDDIRHFEPISLPEHLQDNSIATLYRTNKYRVVLSNPAYTNLLQFLESKDKEGGSVMNAILSSYCSVKTLDRAADDRFSFAAMLSQIGAGQTFPAEDEGIPGHHPGSAYTGDNPAMAGTLPRLRLGKMPMEPTLEEDVRAELAEEDQKQAPPPGRNTLTQEFEEMIKKEEEDEAPSRTDIPFPESTARDVHVEVKRVMEHRDRFEIKGRTGGVGPGVSVCMFTFHNTFDNINCMDVSDDNSLIAAGFQQSYIRVWSVDGKPIPKSGPEFADMPESNSHRLIGHSGAVYAVAFPPCSSIRDEVSEHDRVHTGARWLLSSAADKTIRLWSLDTWQCMVIYKGHDGPVWDLRWGPFGHYFVSGSNDRTARLWVSDHIRQQRIFVGHDQDADCVCFHPNSAYVFTASSDHTVRMWAITTGNAVRMFTGHTGNITAMECSRDGKLLASADDQGTIILWDLAPGRLLKRMRGHGKGGIWSLSWSVESTVIVSGGADGTVRVWDVAGPQEGQGRIVGEGGAGAKIDAGPTPAGQNKKKKAKETVVTSDQISAFPTKKTPVYKVKFTNMNLVLACGAYLP